MARITRLLCVLGVLSLSTSAFVTPVFAVPLSVNILDHDFTFDVPYYTNPTNGDIGSAVYDFAGAGPDVLRLTQPNLQGEGPAGWHNAASYVFANVLSQVPGGPAASQWLYPLFFTGQYGAKLEIELPFSTNDGPYVNPAGDKFDISLNGEGGFLRITGWIGTQGWPGGPLYPTPPAGGGPPTDITLLEIQFTETSLLAREDTDTADLIEAMGQVTMLLGQDVSQFPELSDGVTFFKFMLPDSNGAIFPVSAAAPYDPLFDYQLLPVYGRISGEAGIGLPEPATMSLLAVGGLMLIKRRRKR